MIDLQQSLQRAVGDAFRLEGELPGGGMSRVFLATEASLNRRVVIKVLPPELTSEVSAARFKQEMEFAARLQHPHILPVLAAGAREGLLYYVMPFASGESLRWRLEREGQLTTAETLRLVTEVADALAFAHGHGIIHRDIKPENILLEGTHAVLADFGIARALIESRTGDRLTITGVAVGTPGYMSPEQLAGESIDARTDVYALAVVAYEMLAGAPPFTGPTAQALLAAHLTQSPRPLDEVRPDVSLTLSAVIARALSKDVADRFASAADFAQALQASGSVSAGSGEVRHVSRAGRRLLRIVVPVLALTIAGVVLVRAMLLRSESRALFFAVNAAADSGDFDEVARLLDDESVQLAGGKFGALIPRIAGMLTITSTPPNAVVSIIRTTPVEGLSSRPPILLGQTPLTTRPVVVGEYLLRLAAPDHDTLDLLVYVTNGDTASIAGQLLGSDSTPGMVLVSGTDSGPADVRESFLISRYETTNAQFQRFVDAGAYRNPTFWPETMLLDGQLLSREQALPLLVDATGLQGPRQWSAGRFPDDKGNHPVSGVTWYEANAYARWAGGALPTGVQWWRAALGDGAQPFPWGADGSTIDRRANFGLAGTTEAGSHPLGVSQFGAHDLAGNVAEWLGDTVSPRNRRIAVGGSWRDPSYMFERSSARLFEPGAASEIIGFRIVRPARAISGQAGRSVGSQAAQNPDRDRMRGDHAPGARSPERRVAAQSRR